MFRKLSGIQFREWLLIAGPALLTALVALWFASRFIEPAPPKTISITTGGESGGYFSFGRRYARALARSGITLEVHASKGSVENLARLKLSSSPYQVALLQGGIPNAKEHREILSVGRVFLEPLWVFYRAPDRLESLADLKGRRLAVGSEGSGTRQLALQLLAANDIDASSAALLPHNGQEAVDGLLSSRHDAIFLVMAPESALVQRLLRDTSVKLMSLVHAEAYTRRFPFLSRITLPRGVVDLVRNIPERDIELVAPMAVLAVRDDLHPALIGLLVEAAREVHAPGGLFHRTSEFPRAIDPELELSEDAERIYKNGPPVLQRYLPFWLATFVERMKILLVPLLTLVLPLVKLVPWLYRWRIKRRIYYWYGRLKELEVDFSWDSSRSRYEEHRAEIRRIDEAVASIPVPRAFADQYYSLRAAVDLVKQRIGAGAGQAQPA